MELIPQAREIVKHAEKTGQTGAGAAVTEAIEAILDRPEHKWFEEVKKAKDLEQATRAEAAAPAEQEESVEEAAEEKEEEEEAAAEP